MLIWGSDGGDITLRDLGKRICPLCHNTTTFRAKLYYRYAHLWFLCSWITHREYVEECGYCRNRFALDSEEAKRIYPKDPIPLYRRWGWAFFLVAAALLIYTCVSSFSASTREKDAQTAAYLASPRQHELYLTDLAAIPDSGFTESNDGDAREHAYGVMKLISVDKDELIFATSTTAFTQPSGVIDMLDRSPYLLNFDAQNLLAFDRKDLRHLWEVKVIHEIRRR